MQATLKCSGGEQEWQLSTERESRLTSQEYVKPWAQTGQVQGSVSWFLRYVTI